MENLLLFDWLCVSSIKTGTRRIVRLEEVSFEARTILQALINTAVILNSTTKKTLVPIPSYLAVGGSCMFISQSLCYYLPVITLDV